MSTSTVISNRRLFKPFVSPARNKPSGNATTRKPQSLKRLFSVRKARVGGQPLAKKTRLSTDSDTDKKDTGDNATDEECLPGINYNGLSKKLFKPFRPPKPIRLPSGGQEDGSASAHDQQVPDGKLAFRSLGIRRRMALPKGPRYNPDTEDAVVLYRPEDFENTRVTNSEAGNTECDGEIGSDATQSSSNTRMVPVANRNKSLKSLLGRGDDSTSKEVAVVVDPALGRKLRPHQIEGVKFLYNCVTGKIYDNAFGCIMADEMGLGKTLQCIALLWTLLQQSATPGKPTIEKCIVACPSSLVKNWANEIVKWLGSTKISPLACDNKGTKEKVQASLRQFISARGRMIIHPVLIISYETLRTYIDTLKTSPVGLLLCDEGHRLKNSNSQTFQALNSLQIQRRVILSGTPIQNDLTEYFSLLNFTNPGLLGTPNEFRKKYELPILRGRDSLATDSEQKRGDERLAELNSISSKVIIRRTNDLLTKYLPTKYEHVVFCPLTDMQTDLYELFLETKEARAAIGDGGKCSLQTIISLGKLCNHPNLLDIRSVSGYEKVTPAEYFADSIKPTASHTAGRRRAAVQQSMTGHGSSNGGRQFHPKWSSKMALLDRMLAGISKGPERDKIVLISNYTQTLDLFELLCRARGYGHYRLDGSMTIQKRQHIVDRFNDPKDSAFVFLLSSKAGGCGINLIGANRLVLFDSSFNPADNLQACGRIWRDGQKKTCYIYTFATTGTVEEKIFQRQSYKTSLSTCVIDEQENVERHFSRDQMRQLFRARLRGQTMCDTHDQFKCRRCVRGIQAKRAPEPMDYADHNSWDHFCASDGPKIHDQLLKTCMGKDVSFVFQYKSH